MSGKAEAGHLCKAHILTMNEHLNKLAFEYRHVPTELGQK